MEFKYASSIMISHIGYVFKLLVWIVLCVLIVAGIAAAIFIPIFDMLAVQTDLTVYIGDIGKLIDSLFNADIGLRDFVAQVGTNLQDILADVTSNAGGTAAIVFSSIFVYMVYCFLSGLAHLPMADIINKLMSSNLKFGFASNMVLNFKKSVKYSFSRLLVTFPLDVLIGGIIIGLGIGLFKIISLFAMPILLVIGVVLCSLRAMIMSGWLPRLLYFPEEKIFTAFSRSFVYAKHNFRGYFTAYAITFSCAYLFAAALSIPSFGLIALILPAIYYFLLRTVELIGYYKLKGLRFYTDASTVVDTVEFGFRLDSQGTQDTETDDTAVTTDIVDYESEFRLEKDDEKKD